jgi:uncharacterized repeat protein (TIGR03803 family)
MTKLHTCGNFSASGCAGRLLLVIFASLAAAPTSHAGTQYQLLKSFGFPELAGGTPSGRLIQGSDGALYGTTGASGFNAFGTVFKVNTDGSGYRVLYRFDGSGAENPSGGLLEGSDGVLYGTTYSGGSSNAGTVFRLTKDGTDFAILHAFTGSFGFDGRNPEAGLIEGSDGALYGSAYAGGINRGGTIFKVNKDGSGFTVLYSFLGGYGEGFLPVGTLLRGGDGALYGVTASGGQNGSGTIFKLNEDGSGYEILHSFDFESGPPFPLIEGSDGALYGVTFRGGTTGLGTVFKLNKDGSGYTMLRDFGINSFSYNPSGALLEASDGTLYGTTAPEANDSGSVFAMNKDGSGYRVVGSFGGRANLLDPPPQFGLVEGRDGALYGTTDYASSFDAGTVFKLNKNGSYYASLHTFSASGGDGAEPGLRSAQEPQAGLIEATDGVLYGTTTVGGSFGGGTVFRLNKDGTGYKILESFKIYGPGQNPITRLVEGTDGALYGSSEDAVLWKVNKDGSGFRALSCCAPSGLIEGSDRMLYGTTGAGSYGGTVSKISMAGSNYTVLHSFNGTAYTGGYPVAVLEASDGALYGVTYGNVFTGSNGFGTVFRLNKDGSSFSTLHSFNGTSPEGAYPDSGLFEGSDGALYGTTAYGGGFNAGTVFKLYKDGSGFSTLHEFTKDNEYNWRTWHGALVEGHGGALYGTIGTSRTNAGTLYKINKDGSGYSVLHSFGTSAGDAYYPNGLLVNGSDGALYGTGGSGGDLGLGAVFRLLVNDPPVAIARAFPLVSFSASDTNGFVISLNNINASVHFDGSQSFDMDKDPLRFFWLEEGSAQAFAASVIATNVLSVGSHAILLVVSDGFDTATNRIVVEVVTAGQAVERLIAIVNASSLSQQDMQPLVAALGNASEAFDRGNPRAGVNQLEAFQSKVRVQVSPNDPPLAEELIQAAQKIIDAFTM